jgi:hypothetical protein
MSFPGSEATPPGGAYHSYLGDSSAPLVGLYFTLPLFIVYHAGLWWLKTFAGLRWANAVDIAIADFFALFGVAGPLLSFMLVISVFLVLQTVSGRRTRRPPLHTWIFMLTESLILSLPVFMLSRLTLKLGDYVNQPFLAVQEGIGELSWRANLILGCGAGVYEEFFFRLLVMGAASLVLDKVFGIRDWRKFFLAAAFQALLFALSHHLPGGPEALDGLEGIRAALPALVFRTAAGLYFAFIYLERGFGIAAGSHASYDLLVVWLDSLTFGG